MTNFEITAEDVKARLDAKQKFLLLDVRESWEREVARIEPSLHIPMGEIPARLPEIDPAMHIIVYCHHGVRSLNATAWLRQQGFPTVHSLQGGINRWSRHIDSAVPLY